MIILIRSCGERTEKKCVEAASRQGNVEIIRAHPFGEAIRQTYQRAIEIGQKWTPVIDADTVLFPGVIKQALNELNKKTDRIFCLDGTTDDKIMIRNRRAGVHIYRTEYLEKAFKYIDNKNIKPESYVRKSMQLNNYLTCTSKIVFGKHDYDQYYKDLWRKAVAQTRKLAGMIKKRPLKWEQLSKTDLDYKVIYLAHQYGKKYKGEIIIDVKQDFNAEAMLKKYKIKEKNPL